MIASGSGDPVPQFPDEELLTHADAEAMAERLGLVIVTDGNRFEYARPGMPRPGWRRFVMVQKPRRLNALEPQ